MLSKNENNTFAAFDFDHTLINCDSFVPFLTFQFGILKTFIGLISLTPYFLLFICGLYSRQKVKEKIIHRFLAGKDLNEVQHFGKKYASQKLDAFIKPEAMACLKWHQQQGHRCLIVSASPDFYLIPWAFRHQFEAVISSQLAVNEDNQITGKLKGMNCWGAEKEKRLKAYIGNSDFILYVYGDSQGDKEMLEMANYSHFCHFPNY